MITYGCWFWSVFVGVRLSLPGPAVKKCEEVRRGCIGAVEADGYAAAMNVLQSRRELADRPASSRWDMQLLEKYSVSGPRYTSYPPATKFHSDEESIRLEAALEADNRDANAPLSLYFHLPFCQTRCWYCGCNTVITKQPGVAAAYLDTLELELAFATAHLNRDRSVSQVHFGGGTPTYLAPTELRRLGRMIRQHFQRFADDVEFSVEIDPRRLTREHVMALRDMGVNRASLGIQDTDPRVQLAIHRIQPHQQNETAFEWLRVSGVKSINVDLIYGLPLQTPASFARTIDTVLGLSPDRLSIFSYAHVPWVKPAQRIFDLRQQLPKGADKLRMFTLAHERLTAAGYIDIGLDHFAKPHDELALAQRAGRLHRNFQGYSTRAGASLYGFGVSSISATPEVYWQNFKTLDEWRAALELGRRPVERGYRLTDDDQRRRVVIMRLMCDRRLNFASLSAALGLRFEEAYAAELASMADLEEDGVVERTATELRVTPRGQPLLRVVAMRFDATLENAAGLHSRVI
jgi:oxygen-independent coproporphyrinogen III oxidase